MSNKTVTNNNTNRGILFDDAIYVDDTLTVGGAGTTPIGTILARDSSTGKLVPFVKGGSTNENGIPKVVLANEVVAAGAGDNAVRVGVNGSAIKGRLIIAADGDASNIDAVVKDQLRDYSITVLESQDLTYYEA